jgi:DNA-binding GntR family transcriptional regulator
VGAAPLDCHLKSGRAQENIFNRHDAFVGAASIIPVFTEHSKRKVWADCRRLFERTDQNCRILCTRCRIIVCERADRIYPAEPRNEIAATRFRMSKKSTRVDVACKALRQAIIEQALPPGTKLPEDEVGARFGMSRTLVRAALAQLQSEGLVDAPPRRTATTAKPTLEQAREVFWVRRTLEREAVRLVIARWRPEFGAELEGHVREEEAARRAGEARVSIRLAGEFHIKLGEMSGNSLLRRYLGEVVSRCSLILALYGRPHSADCAVNEHREIVAALRGGNADAATAVMDHHLGSVEHRARLDRDEQFDLGTVLSRYAEAMDTGASPAEVARLPKQKVRAAK